MSKVLTVFLLTSFALLTFASYGATAAVSPSFPPVNWSSKDPHDSVTIENGTGTPIVVLISVDKVTTPTGTAGGINVSNCGKTTYISAGSTAVCYNSDPAYPVNFASDSSNTVSGVYQVSQR